MLCPKCRNNVTGSWCVFCGEKLENVSATPAENTDTQETNGNNNAYREEIYNDEPSENYISPEDAINPYNDYYGEEPPAGNNKTKIIAIVSIVVSVLILAGVLLYVFVFSKDDDKKSGNNNPKQEISREESENNAKLKSLTKDGEKYLSNGNYKKAEEIYLELTKLTDDEEVKTIYEILNNYNKALESYDDSNYDLAEDYFNDIPEEYKNYDIKPDVEDLEDAIKAAQDAVEALDEIEDYIKDGDLESARDAIESIDSRDLPPAEKERLTELTEELEKAEEKEKEKSRSYDYPESGYGRLRYADAQSILEEYCYCMVEAINYNDFDIVSPYILSTSKLYDDQKKLVESCNNQGILEEFQYVELEKLTEISKTKWEAKVTEAETIYTPTEDGEYTEEYKVFEWAYTIEYVDHYFYISAIE